MENQQFLELSHTETEEFVSHGINISCVYVKSEQAAELLEKECGLYITLRTGVLDGVINFENICICLVEQLRPLLADYFGKPLCIYGIGNPEQI